jgi:hypothetical protein
MLKFGSSVNRWADLADVAVEQARRAEMKAAQLDEIAKYLRKHAEYGEPFPLEEPPDHSVRGARRPRKIA